MSNSYQIEVIGRHVLVTEAMKAYATDKIGKMEKFTDRIVDVVVTMDIQRNEHRCDVVMKVGNLKVVAHASTQDMYASIDAVVHKLERQLQRYKSKLQEHHNKGLNAVDMQVNVYQSPTSELELINQEIEAENARRAETALIPPLVISKEIMPLKTLTLTEAIRDIDLSSDPFLIYRSEEDQRLKVLYWGPERSTLGVVEIEA